MLILNDNCLLRTKGYNIRQLENTLLCWSLKVNIEHDNFPPHLDPDKPHSARICMDHGQWYIPRWYARYNILESTISGYAFGICFTQKPMDRASEQTYSEYLEHLLANSEEFDSVIDKAAALLEQHKIGHARKLREWQQFLRKGGQTL